MQLLPCRVGWLILLRLGWQVACNKACIHTRRAAYGGLSKQQAGDKTINEVQ